MTRQEIVDTMKYCLEHGSMGGRDCWLHVDKSGHISDDNARDHCLNKDCKTGCVVTTLREAATLLEDPTIDVPSKWVSVNDRLPEVDRPVLVYAIGKLDWLIGSGRMVITTMSDRNWFDCNIKVEPYWVPPWQYFTTDYEITHWRFLPEPPQGGCNDQD